LFFVFSFNSRCVLVCVIFHIVEVCLGMNVQYLVLTINNFLTRLNYKLIFQLLSFFLNKKFDSSGIFLWLGSRGRVKGWVSKQKVAHNICITIFCRQSSAYLA